MKKENKNKIEKKICMNNCGGGCFHREKLICDCLCHKALVINLKDLKEK